MEKETNSNPFKQFSNQLKLNLLQMYRNKEITMKEFAEHCFRLNHLLITFTQSQFEIRFEQWKLNQYDQQSLESKEN